MKRTRYFLPILFAGIVACNSNDSKQVNNDSTAAFGSDTGKIDDDATEFITEVLSSGAVEIELGKLAQANASNPQVKAFGAMMVKEHTMAGDELKAIAAQKNIAPDVQMQIDDVEKLRNETGINFDKKYIKMMLSAHRKDIKKFEDMAKDDDDAVLKAFAAKTLPMLKMHLDSAKAINKGVKASLDPNDISDAIERYPNH